MTKYEVLSLLVALIAALIALYGVWVARRAAADVKPLHQVQTDLAELQRKDLLRARHERAQADVRASLVRDGRSFRLTVENIGASAARNLRLSGLDDGSLDSILAGWKPEEHFPRAELLPGESVALLAAVHFGSRFPIRCILTWDDDSGDNRQREAALDL
ncbi:MAG: hypothetical protein AB7P99_06955 [Vicinamibacterales bacterium]